MYLHNEMPLLSCLVASGVTVASSRNFFDDEVNIVVLSVAAGSLILGIIIIILIYAFSTRYADRCGICILLTLIFSDNLPTYCIGHHVTGITEYALFRMNN